MSELHALQAAFWQALHAPQQAPLRPVADWVAAAPGMAPAARLAVYQRMYVSRLVDALADDFGATRKLLGAAAFGELARAYLREHPSHEPSIAHVGASLPAFAAQAALPRPDVAELVALEAARSRVFGAAAAAPLPPDAFVAQLHADPTDTALSACRLTFVPAFALVPCEHAIGALWRELEAERSPPPPARTPQTLAVWRPTYDVLHTTLVGPAATAANLAHTGAPLGAVFEAFAELPDGVAAAFAAVMAWFADGWVARLTPPAA